jgi:hypothetical protein
MEFAGGELGDLVRALNAHRHLPRQQQNDRFDRLALANQNIAATM